MTTNRYTGLRRCAGDGFAFYHPIEWRRAGWEDDRDGVVLLPDEADTNTLFAVATSELGEELDPGDAAMLAEELEAAIGRLDRPRIIELEHGDTGPLRSVNATFTFAEGDEVRQRWVRILAQGRRQLTVTAQGSTVDAYRARKPQFFTTMASVEVHRGAAPPDPSAPQ